MSRSARAGFGAANGTDSSCSVNRRGEATGKARSALRSRCWQDEPIELTIVRAVIRLQGADLQVAVKDGKLHIEAGSALSVLDFEKGAPITVVPMSSSAFFVDGGDHTRMAFERDEAGRVTRLVLNPGPWQITGQRIN